MRGNASPKGDEFTGVPVGGAGVGSGLPLRGRRLGRQFLPWLICAFCLAWPAWAQVELNTATQSELESLPGIGPAKAQAIIEYRRVHGPFKRVEDLERVKGIGPATVARLKPHVTVVVERRRASKP